VASLIGSLVLSFPGVEFDPLHYRGWLNGVGGSCVVGLASWVVRRGSWVVRHGSWVVGRGYGVGRRIDNENMLSVHVVIQFYATIMCCFSRAFQCSYRFKYT
jgi:hypothetical protein